jgi:hypothetical protein
MVLEKLDIHMYNTETRSQSHPIQKPTQGLRCGSSGRNTD